MGLVFYRLFCIVFYKMLFNSIQFLIFFIILLFVYFIIPFRYRWILLLTASYYFYMSWKAEYVILILISTLVSYLTALQIGRVKEKKIKRRYLIVSILVNLGILFCFKYFNFFSDSIRLILTNFSISFNVPYLQVLLPIGISFYTFQTLSYSIDVYNGKINPEKHLGIFALYVSFFPQLVAGPIERAKNLLPQFYKEHKFDYERICYGLKLMLWGFFLKLVIADRLAMVVDTVYNNVTNFTGIPLILATGFFSFQIYCDFAGYSFIAIGAAKIMGFNLMDNFRRPYFSKSISEFWKRWHISLSTWFKDYLYIPLGGNRVKKQRWFFNLFIVFLIAGLWHGASFTFIIWGALHGLYLIFAIITKDSREKFANLIKLTKFPKIYTLIKVLITFVLVSIAWIFFRANSISDATYILTHLFSGWSLTFSGIDIGIGWVGLIIAFSSIFLMEFVHLIQEHIGIKHFLSKKPILFRWIVYIITILMIILFGIFRNKEFIYFQF